MAGATPTHAARWAAVGNWAMSAPVSAMITCAVLSSTPGMVCSSSNWCAHGVAAAIVASSSTSAASTWSSRCSIAPTSSAWWSSKCPVGASIRSGILRSILECARSAIAAASRLPATSSASIDHADTVVTRRRDRGELDRGVLQQLLQPDRVPGPVTHQLDPVAGQVPQPADLRCRHERRCDQPVLEELGDPLRVLHIRFPTRHRLHVRRRRLHPGQRPPHSTSQSAITCGERLIVRNVRVSDTRRPSRPGV